MIVPSIQEIRPIRKQACPKRITAITREILRGLDKRSERTSGGCAEAVWSAPKDPLTYASHLREKGIVVPHPKRLDDATLHRILWRMIGTLAEMDVFLVHTDHLSDRELYTRLRNDWLMREIPGKKFTTYFDCVGSFSEMDLTLLYTYYNIQDALIQWKDLFPEKEEPKQRKPPYNRDVFLPKPML